MHVASLGVHQKPGGVNARTSHRDIAAPAEATTRAHPQAHTQNAATIDLLLFTLNSLGCRYLDWTVIRTSHVASVVRARFRKCIRCYRPEIMQSIGFKLVGGGRLLPRAHSPVGWTKSGSHTRFCTAKSKLTPQQASQPPNKGSRGFFSAASLLLMGCCLPIGALLLPGKDDGGTSQFWLVRLFVSFNEFNMMTLTSRRSIACEPCVLNILSRDRRVLVLPE